MPTVANICPISCNTGMENCNGGDTVQLVLLKRYRFSHWCLKLLHKAQREYQRVIFGQTWTFGSPVKVYDSLAAQWSAFQGHHSPLTCSSILPASPGFDPEGSTVLRWPLKQKGFIFKTKAVLEQYSHAHKYTERLVGHCNNFNCSYWPLIMTKKLLKKPSSSYHEASAFAVS